MIHLKMRSLTWVTVTMVLAACGGMDVQEAQEVQDEGLPTEAGLPVDGEQQEVYFTVDETGQVRQDVTGACPHCESRGAFDVIHTSQLYATGWACTPYYPGKIYNISIQRYAGYYQGWIPVGTGAANRPRDPAVGQLCGGNPNHGFHIPLGSGGPGAYRMVATAFEQNPMYLYPTYQY
ncbi:hypothetical protein HV824_34585 [Myxococcus sp. AM009]|uniref:hypothetical protein n=1 Tax=Myxococcus sp. AM009 TaxID=2745137 RepID=UPI0015962617|nr:hypothetical protein [Myxococcus sp. AM009]NVJ03212.1 hypothetical protein [Myxococcus sp. AM009]